MNFLRPAALLLLTQAVATAQAPAPAKPRDAIRNGGFERTLQSPNLWSGVDREGLLAGSRGTKPVLNASGTVVDTPMPISVAVGDLNGDGLADIVSADPLGYIRIYFNKGSREEPKFTAGEMTLPFLALPEGDPPWVPPGLGGGSEAGAWMQRWGKRRQAVRISLSDAGGGRKDLVAGNYFGEIFIIRNTGSAQAPQFSQPRTMAAAIVPTMKDANRRWGNVFAPLLHDWDGDGRPDLLVGEGSYSANNIHLLLNQGAANAPVFNEDKRQPLALGEGREQLTPALADFNGNGRMDILVTDRGGLITVYLRPDNWKPGDTIAPSGYLAKSGGLTPDVAQALQLGSGIHTIATGDLNGDGLFDLVVGKPNGRIAWAPNTGSKEAPKFETPKDIAGEKPKPPAWSLPSQWEVETSAARGNFFAYASCVTAEDDPAADPREGTRALKFGYATPANTIVPRPSILTPASVRFDRRGENQGNLFQTSAEVRAIGAPSNFFILRQPVQLEIGKTYNLSFQAKGSKVSGASYTLGWRASKQLGEDRIVRGERGAVRRERNIIADSDQQSAEFRPSGSWAAVNKSYKIEFKKERALNQEPTTSSAMIEISFELAAPDGFLYLDDIKLVPQG
jgi:hypothetical protein